MALWSCRGVCERWGLGRGVSLYDFGCCGLDLLLADPLWSFCPLSFQMALLKVPEAQLCLPAFPGALS